MSSDQHGLEDLAREINQAHKDVQQHLTDAVSRALDAGRYLIQAQEEVGHGKWMRWVGKNVRFADRTARLYMRLVYLLDEMPDIKDQLGEASLRIAHDKLEDEYKTRYPDRHIDLRAVETNIREGVDKVQHNLDLVFRKLGKERGGAWLANFGIDPDQATEFIRATARWHLGAMPGDPTPPLALPPAPTKSQRRQNGNALPIPSLPLSAVAKTKGSGRPRPAREQ
jgi:hypothetical protein